MYNAIKPYPNFRFTLLYPCFRKVLICKKNNSKPYIPLDTYFRFTISWPYYRLSHLYNDLRIRLFALSTKEVSNEAR